MSKTARMIVTALLRPEDRALGLRLGALLAEAGHRFELRESGEELLNGGPCELVVADAQLPGQWSGLGLVEALRASGQRTSALLVGDEPAFPLVRQALRLGVEDFLARPLELETLLAAVERVLARRGEERCVLARDLPATPDGVALGARAASAFLLERGVRPSHRVRVATALAEVLHLVCDASGSEETPRRVGLRLRLDEGHVALDVEAHGRNPAMLAGLPPVLPGFPRLESELSRARRLCEELEVHPVGSGSRVRLFFELFPLRFAEVESELAETDFLHPDATRRVLAQLLRRTGRVALPPILTTTLGRLLENAPGSPAAQPVRER